MRAEITKELRRTLGRVGMLTDQLGATYRDMPREIKFTALQVRILRLHKEDGTFWIGGMPLCYDGVDYVWTNPYYEDELEFGGEEA